MAESEWPLGVESREWLQTLDVFKPRLVRFEDAIQILLVCEAITKTFGERQVLASSGGNHLWRT